MSSQPSSGFATTPSAGASEYRPRRGLTQPRVQTLLVMVFSADQSVMRVSNSIDAATLWCFIEEYLAGTEGDVDDDEVRAVREALQAKGGIPLVEQTVVYFEGSNSTLAPGEFDDP
jgi:hypothetical protein